MTPLLRELHALSRGSRASQVPVVCADLPLPQWHCALLRPSNQSLAVEHVNTSDQPRRQPYWYHPRVVRLSVIGHSQWLSHGLGTLYRNTFGTRLLFPSSAEN